MLVTADLVVVVILETPNFGPKSSEDSPFAMQARLCCFCSAGKHTCLSTPPWHVRSLFTDLFWLLFTDLFGCDVSHVFGGSSSQLSLSRANIGSEKRLLMSCFFVNMRVG